MPYEDDEQPDREAGTAEVSEADEKLLQHIRKRYTSLCELWRPIREESQKDKRYICGDPWDDKDRKARQEAGRPCINHDELSQYVNQAVNTQRQNKRAIKVEPEGNGASEKSAEFREDAIRAIQYKSKAQSIFLRAFQDMVEGSYGYFRIGRRYVSEDVDGPDDQEIKLEAILNPDSVLYGFDCCKEPDWSDARDCFVVEPMSKEDFKREYPKARIQDFYAEHREVAREWIGDNRVLVAEYWYVETKQVLNKRKTRKVKQKKVIQYITNGVEILSRTEQPGTQIPIIPVIGLLRYIDEGNGPKVTLFSLVRLARDPQMSLAYLVSQQMEEAGLTPKTPYIGYTGQFETDKPAWKNVTKQAYAFLQVDPVVDAAGGQILPLPQRVPFTPNFQEYEVAKDSCRRAIQAAMGISPLPTAAQRTNEKSGVAIERIQSQEAIGSYHFTDGFDRALELAGRIIESWIDTVYDTERDVALRKPDDSHEVARINTDVPYVDSTTGEEKHFPVPDQGDHAVTITTGPSYESQREEAGEFLDTLLQQLPNFVQLGIVAPPAAAKLVSMAISMRQLGPKGEQMAEIIDPENPDPNKQIAGMQQQMQMSQVAMQELGQKVQQLEFEKKAKIVDNQFKSADAERDRQLKLAIAEVETKAQNVQERLSFVEEFIKQQHSQFHEAALQAQDQAHERQQATSQQAHEATQSAIAAQQPQEQPTA